MNGSGRISAVVPLLALTALLAGCATPFQKRLAEAQKGDRRAQYDVALCYATGRGIGPKGTKGDPSPEEAVRWLEQAADKDGEACLALGLFHYYRRGVRDDWDSYQKAFYHIRRAAERNVPGALYWQGECYLKGRGVDQDVKKAIDCFRKCAEQTDRAPVQAAASMAKIGHCYLHGTGGHADYVQCRDWFRKAKDAGDKGAAEMLKKLSQAYFNKVQGLGDDSDGGNAELYAIENSEYDAEEDTFTISASLAKGASSQAASETLKAKVRARCENDLVLRVPGLNRNGIYWKWERDAFKNNKIELKLIWYYLHVVAGSEKYDRGSRIGSLEFDTAFQSEEAIQKYIATEINAFCSTKLAAVEDGNISGGTMFKETGRERTGPEKRLLVVTFKVLN